MDTQVLQEMKTELIGIGIGLGCFILFLLCLIFSLVGLIIGTLP